MSTRKNAARTNSVASRPHAVWACSMLIACAATMVLAQDAAPAPSPLEVLMHTLAKMEAPAAQAGVLRGINASLKGHHGVAAPAGWDELYAKLRSSPDAEVRQQAQALSVVFGGTAALGELRQTLTDPNATLDARKAALESLVAAHDPTLAPPLLDLLKQPGPLRAPALRALSGYEDPAIAPALLDGYAGMDSAEKREALNTLLVRPDSARALLAAIDAKTLDRGVITAPLARQLQSLKDPAIDSWMTQHWGAVRTTAADKQVQIARMKQFLTTDLILHADPTRGRALFTQTCGLCHTLFGSGGKIGPELPGSFEDVDYLLQNIVDPNAIIGKDYQQTFVKLKDGQMVNGIIAGDDAASVTLKTLAGEQTLQRADIVDMKVSDQSMMPEGLLTALDEESVRDLFAYLRQRSQVPLLATPANAADFFNGADLTRWKSSAPGAWKVEHGELIGTGNAQKPVVLTSEMVVAKAFTLTAQVQVIGANAAAEIVIEGAPRDGKFPGHSLSLGGTTAPNLWDYYDTHPKAQALPPLSAPTSWTKIEFTVKDGHAHITLGGQPPVNFEIKPGRTQPALYLLGDHAELHVKDLRLQDLE